MSSQELSLDGDLDLEDSVDDNSMNDFFENYYPSRDGSRSVSGSVSAPPFSKSEEEQLAEIDRLAEELSLDGDLDLEDSVEGLSFDDNSMNDFLETYYGSRDGSRSVSGSVSGSVSVPPFSKSEEEATAKSRQDRSRDGSRSVSGSIYAIPFSKSEEEQLAEDDLLAEEEATAKSRQDRAVDVRQQSGNLQEKEATAKSRQDRAVNVRQQSGNLQEKENVVRLADRERLHQNNVAVVEDPVLQHVIDVNIERDEINLQHLLSILTKAYICISFVFFAVGLGLIISSVDSGDRDIRYIGFSAWVLGFIIICCIPILHKIFTYIFKRFNN